MNDFAGAFDLLEFRDARPLLAGVVVGIVTQNDDPDGLARVKVRFPWLSDDNSSRWARITTAMAGPELGAYVLPEVGDEVLVAFAHGRADQPYVIGSLWNGKARPPASTSDGENSIRRWRTGSFEISIDEKQKRLTVSDRDGKKAGKNRVTIDAKTRRITLTCAGDVAVEAQGELKLEGKKGVTVASKGGVRVKAGANLELEASARAKLRGAVTNVRGNPINLN